MKEGGGWEWKNKTLHWFGYGLDMVWIWLGKVEDIPLPLFDKIIQYVLLLTQLYV